MEGLMNSLNSLAWVFGNVDESGQLDNNGLDEEQRDGLQQLVARGRDVGGLLQGILPDAGLDLPAQEQEEPEERNGTPTKSQASFIKPAEDAVDYSEINELAAEDSDKNYQQNANNIMSLKRSLTLPADLNSMQQMMYGDLEYYNQNLSFQSMDDNLEPSKAMNFASELPPSPKEEFDISFLYPEFRPNEVLYFSKLFSPKIPQRKKFHPRNKLLANLVPSPFVFDRDDRVIFEQPIPSRAAKAPRLDRYGMGESPFSSSTRMDDSDDENDLGASLLTDEIFDVETKEGTISSPHQFDSVMMDTWENDIIWDIEDEEDRQNSQSVQPAVQKPAFKVQPRNHELDNGDWLESVLWDVPKKRKPPAKLILDMNDPNMLLDVSYMEGLKFLDNRKELANISSRIPYENGIKKNDFTLRENDLDQYNISNDSLYEGRDQRVRQTYGQLVVQHSLPALRLQIPYFKTKFTKSELRAFHRPSIQFSLDQEIRLSKVKASKKNKKKTNRVTEAMRNSKELTLKDSNNFILLEYSEEYPPVMSNVGMGSLLLNYYRKTDEEDTSVPQLDIGEPVVLDVSDASPFMNFGNVEPGQIFPALVNNLVRAPLFMHTPKPTDFLVIRNTYKGKTKYFIREIKNLFVVGQTYPLQEVPKPSSRKINNTIKNRFQVAALRIMKKSLHHRLKPEKLNKQFPEYNEQQMRPKLKEFAQFQRTGNNKGFWRSKSKTLPTEEQLQAMLTPEMICLYESMLVGQRHLLDSGYGKSTNDDDEGDESKLSIEEQLAPWITTRNFLNATQNKAMLKLHGEGDPTGIDEGFSFIRVSMKDIFLKVGESAEEIQAEIEKLPKSAHKYSVAEQQQRYKEEIDRIWNAQYNSLGNKNELADSTDSEDSHDKHRRHHTFSDHDNVSSSPSSPSIFSPGDFDDAYSADGSMGSRASYAYGSHRNRKLIITRKMPLENGEGPMTQNEEVTDPAVINAYMRHRQMIEEQATSAELLEPTNDEEKNKRLKKRIKDLLAKLKRNAERRQQRKAAREAEASNEVSVPIAKEKKDLQRTCSNCGEKGHMKTNRKCKRFHEFNPGIAPDTRPDTSLSGVNPESDRSKEPVIKVEGGKISIPIPKALIERISEPSTIPPPKTLKRRRGSRETEKDNSDLSGD